jgi:FlaA1/EpsC-like NDP-sugar epimerase
MPDNQVPIISILGSVLDSAKLERVIRHYQVETIYHAAAYKHVPMVEHNIDAGLRTNAFGTHQTARIAGELGVANFVLLSTDKAVRPTNVMGASKRLAEMALQALQQDYSDTRFVMVRFGNVLGSSGSVVPLFREQIVAGGPVTVTHPEVTRFFMTIPEAVSLVIQAGSMGVGGDVFLLDMGEPVKIDMLARKLIRLSGYDVKDASGKGDIGIRYTGLRPGEKLYEELLIGGNPKPTNHPRIMKAHEMFLAYSELADKLSELDKVLSEYDLEEALAILQELIPEYEKQKSVDYLR